MGFNIMIKEDKILINVTSRNKNFYKKSLGKHLIDIKDINKNSKEKITAICDICGSEQKISIQKYYKDRGW